MDPVVPPAPNAAPDLTLSDPIIFGLTWALTMLLSTTIGKKWPKTRHAIPLAAVLLAVFLNVAWDSVSTQAVTWSTLLHGVMAGASAVLAHAQYREFVKMIWPEEPAPTRGADGRYEAAPGGKATP